MFLITWVFDKLGYMPKVSIDANWPFPATQRDYTPHPDEVKPKRAAKKTSVKIPKATTRTSKTKK